MESKASSVVVAFTAAALGVAAGRFSVVETPVDLRVRVHEIDLRTSGQSDGGIEISRRVYGHALRPDGGARDVGVAKACAESKLEQAVLRSVIESTEHDCVWEE